MGCYSILKQQEHAHDDAIWTVCWTSQNDLITGSLDTTAKVWKLSSLSGELKLTEDRVFDGFALGVVSVDVAPKSSTVAVAAMDSKIRLFDLDKPIESCNIKTIDASPIESWKIKFSPDGKFIATSSIHSKLNLFSTNLEGEDKKIQFDVLKFAHSIEFSPDGRMIAAGNQFGNVLIFDLETQKLKENIKAHMKPVRALAFSPDSKYILSGSDDALMKIYDTVQFEEIKTLSGHSSWLLDLNYSPNGTHVASGSADKKVKIWDMSSFECIETFSHHAHQVTGVRYNPNGSRLASVSDDNSIVIYEHIK